MRMVHINTQNFRKLFVPNRLIDVLYLEDFKNFFASTPPNDAVVFYTTKRIEFSDDVVAYKENDRKSSYKLSTTINYKVADSSLLMDNDHTFYYNISFKKKDNTIELSMDCVDTGGTYETEICDLYYSEGFLINLESERSFEEVRESHKRVYFTILNSVNGAEQSKDVCNIVTKYLHDINLCCSFTPTNTVTYRQRGGGSYLKFSDSQKFKNILYK